MRFDCLKAFNIIYLFNIYRLRRPLILDKYTSNVSYLRFLIFIVYLLVYSFSSKIRTFFALVLCPWCSSYSSTSFFIFLLTVSFILNCKTVLDVRISAFVAHYFTHFQLRSSFTVLLSAFLFFFLDNSVFLFSIRVLRHFSPTSSILFATFISNFYFSTFLPVFN